jgi:predicted ribosomally synthesized peptide with nif11-like leader
MSGDQLKAFLDAAKTDLVLQEKIKSSTGPDSVIAIAKAAGFAITVNDLLNTQKDLTDYDLEDIAGGVVDPSCSNCSSYYTTILDLD